MRDEWYVARRGEDGNKRYGPVPLRQLRDLLDAGDVRPDDLVWCEGMAGWLPAEQCDEIHQPARPGNYYGYDRPRYRRPYRPQPSSSGWVIPLVVVGGVLAVSFLSCGGLVVAGILAKSSSNSSYSPGYSSPVVDPAPDDPPPWQNQNFVPDPNPPADLNPPVFVPPDPNPPIFVPPQDPDKNP